MQRTITSKGGRRLVVPTAKEDAAIAQGIAADPDTYEVSEAEMATMQRWPARRGRPPLAQKRPTLNMRIDADVLEALRASGPGWQTRVNALLREAVRRGRHRG